MATTSDNIFDPAGHIIISSIHRRFLSSVLRLSVIAAAGAFVPTPGQAVTRRVSSFRAPPPLSAAAPDVPRPWRHKPPRADPYDIRKTKTTTLTFTDAATGRSVFLYKKRNESLEHVLVKAILWSLAGQSEDGPGVASVELDVGDRRVPDVVVLRNDDTVAFWGESGRMSPSKGAELSSRHPHAHIVHMRWGMGGDRRWVEEMEARVKPTLAGRTAPFEVTTVNGDPRDFFDEKGVVRVRREDFEWRTLC